MYGVRRYLFGFGILALVAAGAVLGLKMRPDVMPIEMPLSKAEIHAFTSEANDVGALLKNLDTLTGSSLSEKDFTYWRSAIERGDKTIEQFVDEVLRSRKLGSEVAPALIFGMVASVSTIYALPVRYTLMQQDPDDQGRVTYYLRHPCTKAQRVKVRPWWALQEEVYVCPDAYQPEKWTMSSDEHSYRSRMSLTCDGLVGSPELEKKPLCGCGPNLIRCLRDLDQFEEMLRSMLGEIRDTTAHVVNEDLPIEKLFTGNETHRDKNVELIYRRQKIGALEVADPSAELKNLEWWPNQGRFAPREELKPGQHAGLLTSPQLLHFLPDRRQRQRIYYEILWCEGRNSFGATTQKVLEVSQTANLAFVHDSWKVLAGKELCTECHARLDYGFQFFMGYPDSRAGTHFVPALQLEGSGPLYGTGIDDPRGAGELTPKGFAELATKQPEFSRCLANKIGSYVLGPHASDEDRHALRLEVEQSHSFKRVMRTAMLRVAERWNATPSRAPPVMLAGAPAPGPDGTIAVSPDLRKLLDEHCVECHDGDEPWSEGKIGKPFDLRPASLPRPLLVRMADQVAFSKMPKTGELEARDRRAILGAIIEGLWTDSDARREALDYYLGRMEALPAHQIDAAFEMISSAAGGADPDPEWGLLERSLYMDQAAYTPNFVAVTALRALKACRQTNDDSESLDRCLDRALRVPRLSRARIDAEPSATR
jgi:hypothetical protein